jgi:hypothetical protein
MKAWLSRLLRSRRTWLAAGVPVAVFVALSSVASVSLFPPSVRGSSLGYAVARMQLNVGPPGGLVDAQPADAPQMFIDKAIALADQTSSPELRDLIAAKSGIDASLLAVDGPLDINQSIFQEEPDGEKRATQIVVQNASYRVIFDENIDVPEIAVTAQAPTPGQAVRLANGAGAALSSYLTGIETSSETPLGRRLQVSSVGPTAVTDDATKSLANIGVLTFVLSFVLWSGLVASVAAIVRDIRSLRPGPVPDRVSR